MSGARRVFAAAILAVGLLAPATAIAGATPPSDTNPPHGENLVLPGALDGILLTGCGPQDGATACIKVGDPACESLATKRIYALQTQDRMWAPFRLADWEKSPVTDLNKVLVPYSIDVSGEVPPSLRARHLLDPGVPLTLTRPGPPQSRLVTCTFEGKIPDVDELTGALRDFAVLVTIQGTIRPFPSGQFPIAFEQTV